MVRETGQLVRLRWLAQSLEHPVGRERVEDRLAATDAAHRVDEVGAPDLLEHIARRTGDDRAEDGFVVGERSQHQARDLGMFGSDVSADLDAVTIGQPHVEHGDVRGRRRQELVGLLRGAGFTDDLQVVFGLEQLAYPATHDLVIVEEEHPRCHGS